MGHFQEHGTPDDPFAGKPERCPQCGVRFPTAAGEQIDEAVATNMVLLADGKAGTQSHSMFFSRCGICRTPIWASGQPTWAECDPTNVFWYRNPNPWATPE